MGAYIDLAFAEGEPHPPVCGPPWGSLYPINVKQGQVLQRSAPAAEPRHWEKQEPRGGCLGALCMKRAGDQRLPLDRL